MAKLVFWGLMAVAALFLRTAESVHALTVIPVKATVSVGDTIVFHGNVERNGETDTQPLYVIVNDPISRVCVKIDVDEDCAFSYSSITPATKEGIYLFKFTSRSSSAQDTEYVLISAKQSEDIAFPNVQVSVTDYDIVSGNQGSSLDEETKVLANRFISSEDNNAQENEQDISWRHYYLESLIETVSGDDFWREWGKRVVKNHVSTSNMLVYAASAIVCTGAPGVGCALAVPFVLKASLGAFIWTDIEMMLDNVPNETITNAERENIKKWSKFGYASVVTVLGLSSEGGFLDATSFVGKMGEIAWKNSPRINKVEYSKDGEISSFTVYATTHSGDVIGYRLARLDDELKSELSPINNYYMDTEIEYQNGEKLLYTTISGEFNGEVYGMPDRTSKNYFIVKDSKSQIHRIPVHDIHVVNRQFIRIASVDGLRVTIDKGKRHQIKEGAIFDVYRESKNIFTQWLEKEYLGVIRVTAVGGQQSTADILATYKGKTIGVYDKCR